MSDETPNNKLREYREAARLTQSELAELVNQKTGVRLSGATISYIERGVSKPRPINQRALAKALDADIDVLFPRPAKKNRDVA